MSKKTKAGNDRGTRGQFQNGRRPHNARKGEEFASFGELVRQLGAEPKRVKVNGKEVLMCWAERSLRLTLERALAGGRRDLAHLIRLAIQHPNIGGSFRETTVIFIRGSLCNV